MSNPILDMYIDWVNNFLTVEKFAEYYGISEELATNIIKEGRYLMTVSVKVTA